MTQSEKLKTLSLGALGAVIGGVVGYYIFYWALRQGFYAIVLPIGFVGLGAGLCTKLRYMPLAVGCAVAGLGLGLFLEWRLSSANDGFGHFLANLHHRPAMSLIMIALGVYLCYTWALRGKS